MNWLSCQVCCGSDAKELNQTGESLQVGAMLILEQHAPRQTRDFSWWLSTILHPHSMPLRGKEWSAEKFSGRGRGKWDLPW
jgi:hypothetical protein